ncbi:hypothetical protein [Trichothermofontia sp.]
MKDLPPLERLSDAAKDTLIHAVWQRVQDLEQRLQDQGTPAAQRVKKTPKNSSQPPSQGFQIT